MRVAPAALMVLAAMAGCADDPAPHFDDGTLRTLAHDDLTASLWSGRTSWSWSGACPGQCWEGFGLGWPAGHLDGPHDRLELLVSWDGTQTAGFSAHLEGPDGGRVSGMRGFDAVRLQAWDPMPGEHRLHLSGQGMYTIEVRLVRPAPQDGMRLPDLVTYAPRDLAFDPPDLSPNPGEALGVTQGCGSDETLEDGARRCLRFSNAIGNVGVGPLEVRLPPVDGALSVGGLGRFVQRIYLDNAQAVDEAGRGTASFHVMHAHFHFEGLADYRVYAVDEATGIRGDEVGRGMKAGFCFIDIGRMETDEVTPVDGPGYGGFDCLVPTPGAWVMGISVGWYDEYWNSLADQYVDLEGVPDGVYELVSRADGGGGLLEADHDNNVASVLFRLGGDDVVVLEERSFYGSLG